MDLLTLKSVLVDGSISLVVLLSLIEITPVKWNPWKTIAKGLGRALNADQTEKIEAISTKVDSLSKQVNNIEKKTEQLDEKIDENEAKHARIRILDFSDGLLKGEHYSQENFLNILSAIDIYERYCDMHEGFKNNVAVASINEIKRVYALCLSKNSFLGSDIATYGVNNNSKQIG